MEYLVTMTTRVPEGTLDETVQDDRARAAVRARALASMPLRVRLTDQVTPLSAHPNDPAPAGDCPNAPQTLT
jgi:muconolactone delta-isomerase